MEFLKFLAPTTISGIVFFVVSIVGIFILNKKVYKFND